MHGLDGSGSRRPAGEGRLQVALVVQFYLSKEAGGVFPLISTVAPRAAR